MREPAASASPPAGRRAEARSAPRQVRQLGAQTVELLSTTQLVVTAAVVLTLGSLSLRAWALLPSWFYADDLHLISQARRSGLGGSYLLDPYDNQFMPVGRFLAWVVESSGGADWTTAAVTMTGVQAVADAACVWMLITAFGARWLVLLPLSLYLWCAIPLTGGMWWAAALNHVPLHIAIFGAVATWLNYARSARLGWLAGTVLFLAFGLSAYVKTALVFPVLAYLLVAYFATGPLPARIGQVVRRYWPALVSAVLMAGLFAWYFTSHVPSLFTPPSLGVAGRLAETMVGTALITGLVGGPWRWDHVNPPVVGADPPAWSVHLTWALVAVALIGLALRRRRTGRAWLLLTLYVALSFLLLYTTRGAVVGEIAGLQYRYLTDVVPVAALCLGLATMPLLGAREPSEPREVPLLLVTPRPAVVTAAAAVVCVSGVVSAVEYARVWHGQDAAKTWSAAVVRSMGSRGPVDLPDQIVPVQDLPGVSYPYNTTRTLMPLLVDNARFPDTSTRLAVLADDGTLRRARIDVATRAQPGPVPGCGWRVGSASTAIPLEPAAIDYDWWVRLSFLASKDDTMTVTIDGAQRTVPVQRGAQQVFLHVKSAVPAVVLGGLDDATVCVDAVEVGQPVPGGLL